MESNRRVLVTGASGFLGRQLVTALLGRGDRVQVLVRPTSSLGDLRGRVDVAYGDVRDPGSLDAAVSGVDVVFPTAGMVSTVAREHQRMFAVNVDGTRNVLRAAGTAG